MKHLLILICLLTLFSPTVHAGWFSKAPDPLAQAEEKIVALETKIAAQTTILNRWQIAAGTLAVGCVVLLIIGTALGATTRKHYDASKRRGVMGSTTGLNGRTSNHVGKTDREDLEATLAA